jgi:hypothetical protein
VLSSVGRQGHEALQDPDRRQILADRARGVGQSRDKWMSKPRFSIDGLSGGIQVFRLWAMGTDG